MEYSGEQFDVIVVGAGIMGSCATYQIAKRSRKVLLLEQFDFLHQQGSSHGESRTIRTTYPEQYYTNMVIESSRLWEEAEAEIGYKVYFKTSHLDMGPKDSKSFCSAIKNCRSNSHTVPCQVLDPEQVFRQFNRMIELPENWVGLSTQLGGIIKPTKAVSMFQTLAITRGAVVKDNMEVVDIKKDYENGGICVCTSNGKKFWGKKCVVTVGAWTQKLVKTVTGLVLPIQPIHTTVCYWKIKEGHQHEFSISNGFPSFQTYGDPIMYGTPSLEYPGLIKIAVHRGYECDPDKRTWVPALLEDSIYEWIEGRFPGKVETNGGPVVKQSCMYAMSSDGDYVIDFLGGEFGKDVVVAGGFSAHGFKMGPVVGRILGDLVLEGEALGVELKYFRLKRFEENPKGNVKEFEDFYNIIE